MALPHQYLLALINPNGRLGQFHFALLAVVIAFAHMYIFTKMAGLPKTQPWNIYSVSLLALLWCKFSILSRRLHDTGSNGLIAVPVLLTAFILYLVIIDQSFIGPIESHNPQMQAILNQGMRIPRALFIAVFIYCIRAQGEAGPNGYGPEFGDDADSGAANSALSRMQDSTMPVHSFKKFTTNNDNGWGERKRPSGFGRR